MVKRTRLPKGNGAKRKDRMTKVSGMDLSLNDLNQFYGTEQYHKLWLGALGTDGVKYVMDNGYSWFVTDSLSVIKTMSKLKNESFLTVKLKLLPNNGAEMVITDGNDNVLYIQKYKYTNAKKELTLFYTDNVLMLSGEY